MTIKKKVHEPFNRVYFLPQHNISCINNNNAELCSFLADNLNGPLRLWAG